MVRVKICGITTVSDALAAVGVGADAVGLNFYPGSPRYVTFEKAEEILSVLPPFVEVVGLFVMESWENIEAACRRLGLRTFQYHDEILERSFPAPWRFLTAWGVKNSGHLRQIESYLEVCQGRNQMPAALLVDAHVPGKFGGTGQKASWDLVATLSLPIPLVLAGGLTPENVAEAVRTVRPYAVDVASGVESAPGIKDWAKMKRFVDQAKGA